MCAVDFLSLFDGDQIQSIAGFPFLDERILHLLVHNEQFFRCIEFSLCSRFMYVFILQDSHFTGF